MRRAAPLLAAVIAMALMALVAGAPAGASTPAPSAFKPCAAKPGDVGTDLVVREVACSNARKVANHFIVVAHGVDDGYHGWKCAQAQHADDPIKNNCRRRKGDRRQKLKFEFAG